MLFPAACVVKVQPDGDIGSFACNNRVRACILGKDRFHYRGRVGFGVHDGVARVGQCFLISGELVGENGLSVPLHIVDVMVCRGEKYPDFPDGRKVGNDQITARVDAP